MEVGPATERIELLRALRLRGQSPSSFLVEAALDFVRRPVRFLAVFTLKVPKNESRLHERTRIATYAVDLDATCFALHQLEGDAVLFAPAMLL